MRAFILNTETDEYFQLEYIDPQLRLPSPIAQYSSADLPSVTMQPLYWGGHRTPTQSINLVLSGANASDKFQQLQTFLNPVPRRGIKSPPICTIQIGSLNPVNCVLTQVDGQVDLTKNQDGKPTRYTVAVTYQEVPESAIVA